MKINRRSRHSLHIINQLGAKGLKGDYYITEMSRIKIGSDLNKFKSPCSPVSILTRIDTI